MKWNFMAIKSIIQLTFVLWCGVVTSTQDNEPLGKNTNTIVCPGPTAAVDFINASNPALLSEMTSLESETSGEYHYFPVKGQMKHAGSKFVLVMICFAIFIVVAATVYRWPMSLLYNSTKQSSSVPVPGHDGSSDIRHEIMVTYPTFGTILSTIYLLYCSTNRCLYLEDSSSTYSEPSVSHGAIRDAFSGLTYAKPFTSLGAKLMTNTHKKGKFAIINFIPVAFFLWYTMATNAQDDDMLRQEILWKNSTTIIRSRPIWNVGIMNSTAIAQLSQMTLAKIEIQSNVPHHHIFVKATRTNTNSNMTVFPAATLLPRRELMKDSEFILDLIIGWVTVFKDSSSGAACSGASKNVGGDLTDSSSGTVCSGASTNVRSDLTDSSSGTVHSGASTNVRSDLTDSSSGTIRSGASRNVRSDLTDSSSGTVCSGASTNVRSDLTDSSSGTVCSGASTNVRSDLTDSSSRTIRSGASRNVRSDLTDSSSGTVRSGASTNVRSDLTDSSSGTVRSGASTYVRSDLTTNMRYTNMKQNFASTMLIQLVVLLGQIFTNAQNNGIFCHELLTKNAFPITENILSRPISVEWDTLAGLMNISRAYRDNDDGFRAEKILSIFNHRKDFSSKNLAHCLEEIQQLELVRPVTTGESRSLPYPAAAEEGDCIPMSIPMERRSKVASICPVVRKKIITVKRSVILTADIVLNISPGCLANNTKITLKNDNQKFAFKSSSLLNLSTVKATSPIVEFTPDLLDFSKPSPAILTIKFEKTVSDSELFILDGSYKWDYQRTVKEISTNFTESNNPRGVVSPKINGFYRYSQILLWRGKLTRLLSYFDRSFTVRAHTFNRRIPSKGTIYISCKFVYQEKKEMIKQLKFHFEPGYVDGEKGMLTRVHTDRCPKICIDFAVVGRTPFLFKVNKLELDTVGFVVEFFTGISIRSPASGIRKIREVHRNAENKFLWSLDLLQMEKEINVEEACVVHRTAKLTNEEITRMSEMVGVDWDPLAALMNIPYSEREEIRVNYVKYPSIFLKARQIFTHFNKNKDFDRYFLKKYLKELGRHDLENEMLLLKNENGIDEAETPPLQSEISVHKNTENIQSRHTRLSSREMYRLSRRISAEWDIFAGLMGIPRTERNDIRDNFLYNNNCSRAEKILSMLNRREDFSREILARCLEEIQQSDSVRPIIAGEWRSLSYPPVPGEEDCIPMSTPMERRSEIQSTTPEPPPEVRNRTTKLTKGEIIRMSDIVGVDCDSLAGLMDVPYRKREQIRDNYKYSSSVLKAMQVFTYFNDSKYFDRCNLKRCFKELGRHDLENEMLPVKNENGTGEAETSPLQSEISVHKKTENIQLRYIPLSPREMYRLSRCICDKWDILAGLMNIPRANRNNIRHDNRYINNRSRAEKILSIINHRKDFSRIKLADCLEEMQQLDLIRPVTTGEWRSLPCPAIVGQEECIPMITLMERRSKISSKCPCLGKNIIIVDGGLIQSGDIVLNISAGCLAYDAEITLKRDEQNFTFKSLPSLGVFKATPPVMEFLANVLKFIKPAIITIGFEKNVSDSEQFILYGSCGRDYQNTVWKLMTNSKEGEKAQGVTSTKINGFFIYSHFNSSFTCCSYAFYRRLLSMGTIDISVVLLSEFVDEKKEENIKQLTDNVEASYVRGGKGTLKCVRTGRRLICLDFSVVESTPFSVGFVVDHFKRITKRNPASGKVKIRKVNRNTESEYMRKLNVLGMEEQINVGEAFVQSTAPDPLPEVVYRTTKLTKGEITRMSDMVGLHWDSLSGLMDIPHSEREEIRVNYAKYPSFSSKAKQIFTHFNGSKGFDRRILQKYFKELGRHDLKDEMLPVENENGTNEEKTQPSQSEISVHRNAGNIQLRYTRLSSREMYRLSRHIDVEWDTLAGLMDIPRADRNDIRDNILYNNNCSRAEKILSIFNHREDFSRENLAYCLKEINQLELIRPVTTGEWRSCMMLTTEQQLSFKLAGWYF